MKYAQKVGIANRAQDIPGKRDNENAAIANGCATRNAARHCFVASAQSPIAPHCKEIAAGPFAKYGEAEKCAEEHQRPPSSAARLRQFGVCRPQIACLAEHVRGAAIASVIQALKSMSGVAARANPIAATLVEKINGASSTGLEREFASPP